MYAPTPQGLYEIIEEHSQDSIDDKDHHTCVSFATFDENGSQKERVGCSHGRIFRDNLPLQYAGGRRTEAKPSDTQSSA
jgi:hypothetical protein